MFKKVFTSKQISLFFHIAVLMNLAGFFLDLVIYHFFSTNEYLKLLTENLNNLSVSMICLTIVSQALFIFAKRHEYLLTNYKLLAISIEACIAMLFIWLIAIEDDIHGKVIIFASSLSKSNNSYQLIITLTAIFIMLSLELYRAIKNPEKINNASVLQIVRLTFKLVLRKHLFLFILMYGILKFSTLKKFAIALLYHSKSSLLYKLSLLEFILPTLWIIAIFYAYYQLKAARTHAK